MNWRRQKYHLNALLLIVPLAYLAPVLETGGGPPADAQALAVKTIGPWHAQAFSEGELNPRPGGQMDILMQFSRGPLEHIRAAFLTVNASPPARERLLDASIAGALHGGAALREAHVPVPRRALDEAALWLTVEAWDGTLHHASWPLHY